MSTFGRDADRIAEIRRRQERQFAEKATRLEDAVRFSLSILENQSIDERQARRAAIDALSLQTSWSYSDFKKT